MTRARGLVLLVVLLAAGCPGVAAAAWTAPAPVAGTEGRYPLLAAFSGGGTASLALYGPLPLFPASPQVPVDLLALTSPAGAPASTGGLGAPVAVSPGGTVLAVGGPRSPLDFFGGEGVSAPLRVGVGTLGEPLQPVGTGAIAATKSLAAAVDDRGDAVVVFSRCLAQGCKQRAVWATYRRRGHAFGRPVRLAARTGYPAAAAAINARGDALVAWEQHRAGRSGNDVRLRLRTADGRRHPTRTAGFTEPVPTIAATLTDAGAGQVAWFSEFVGEGSDGGPIAVASVAVDRTGRAGRRRVLDTGTPGGHTEGDAPHGARLAAVLGSDGVTTLAWTGAVDSRFAVRAARLTGRPPRVQTLSAPGPDATLADLAGTGTAQALAVFTTSAGGQPVVAAAGRGPGAAAFDAPEVVLSGADAAGTAVGALGADGRALVAGGPGEALNGRATPIQVALRVP